MVKRVSFVGHTASQASEYVGAVREVTVDTTNNELRVHDGATAGGHRIMSATAIAAAYFSLAETTLAIDNLVEKTLGAGINIEGVHIEDGDISSLDNVALNTINGVDFDDFVTAYNAHVANVSNPHAVNKAQVGLGNVLNAAQLAIASNLSDVASAATAFANIKQNATDSASGVVELAILSEVDGLVTNRVLVPAILKLLHGKGTAIASANAIAKPADADRGGFYHITGTTEVQTLWANGAFPWPQLFIADAALPLKHSSALILPNGLDVTLSAGDLFLAIPEGSDVWRVVLFRAGATSTLKVVSTAQSPGLLDNGKLYLFTGSGGVAFNLPTIASSAACTYGAVNRTTGNITVTPNGAETVEGLSSVVLRPGDSIQVANNTAAWSIVRAKLSNESSELTYATSTQFTFAHGIGFRPTYVEIGWRAKIAGTGITVGDEYVDSAGDIAGTSYTAGLEIDATNVILATQETYVPGFRLKNGNTVAPASPDWKLFMRAFWFR